MRELKAKLILEEPVDEVVKSVIKEDIEDELDKQVSEIKPEDEVEKPQTTPVTEGEFGIASLLNAGIIDEFEAIDIYNSQIATIKNVLIDEKDEKKIESYKAIVEILTDIVNEENIHVGQLQKALSLVSPNASFIKEGEAEADETVENQ